jgi:hypothetical protein
MVLEEGYRLQIPQLIQWQFKMEQNQVLSVRVSTKRLLGVYKCFLPKWINREEYSFPS